MPAADDVVDYAEERRLNASNQVLASRQVREKKQLKTDLKASTAFVKRVSTISEETAAQLIKDATGDKLNLTRFVEEIVTSLSKAPIKMKDIPAVTLFASAMHRLYDSFIDPFVSSLVDQYEACFKVETKPEIVRRRVLLRWFAELYVSGLVQDSVFLKQLRLATRHGSPPGPFESENAIPLPDQALANLPGVSLLFKQLGDVLLITEEASEGGFPPIRQRIQALLTNYVQMCTARLDSEVGAIKRMRTKMDADNLKRGLQPTAEQMELFERREKHVDEIYQFCHFACTQLLHVAAPPQPTYQDDIEDQKLAQEEKGLELWNRKRGEGGGGEQTLDSWVFGDDTARAFYQDLDDLEILVPRMILDRVDQALQPTPGLITPTTLDVNAATAAPEEEEETLEDEVVMEEQSEDENEQTKQAVESVARPVEDLMARLPSMLSVRAVEAFARDFAHVNSKSARKRLVQELFNVPWGRSELIPFYARLAATLSNIYLGIGKLLVDSVRKAYFRSSRDKRPGSRMSSRVRYAKYLGELVKFGLRFPLLECPPAAAFLALKQTLDSFQGENIDMACVLLETCGRELYRFPRTHPEMARLLEIVQRLKQNKNLTPVQEATVENAYFHCIPPPVSELKKRARRERSEVEQYVRHLLLNKLGAYEEHNREARSAQLQRQSSEVLRALFTLPWNTEYELCQEAVVRTFLASCKSRAGSVPLVCVAVSQVSKTYPNVAITVLDALLEAITSAMETNDQRLNQRRIGQAKCLGHMLRQNLVKDDLFFDILFAILHWGHERGGGSLACNVANAAKYHPAVPCLPSDPPYDGFRVRLVCAALEAASDRIVIPACFPKLDLFLTYLDRYVFCKSYFPLEVEFVLLDTLQDLERKYMQVQQKRVLMQVQKLKGPAAARTKKQAEEFAKLSSAGVQLVGRCANLQAAEDAVAKAEGRGLQKSVLSASATIAEEEDDEEEEEEEEQEETAGEEEEQEEGTMEEEQVAVEEKPQQQPYRNVKEEQREPTAEDIAFELEFAKLMKETVEQSGKANLAGTAAARGDNLVIPLGIAKRPATGQQQPSTSEATTTLRLVKRSAGRKVEVRDMQVPSTIMLAKASSVSKDLQEKEEKEAMKKLTLATTSRMRQEGGFT